MKFGNLSEQLICIRDIFFRNRMCDFSPVDSYITRTVMSKGSHTGTWGRGFPVVYVA